MKQRIFRSVAVNLFFAIALGAVAYGAYNTVRAALVVERQSEMVSRSVEELRNEKQRLEVRLRELDVPEVVEREAKDRLNLQGQGEHVVVVEPETIKERAATVAAPSGLWNWVRSWFLFFR